MKSRRVLVPAVALSLLAGNARAEEVTVWGAGTTIGAVIDPHKASVEQATGYKLDVQEIGTGKGLAALVEGKCDLAITSEPLDISIDAAKVAGATVDPKSVKLVTLVETEVVFIVHPSNPVKTLSWAQIRDIHTGKITNWNQVGGPDLAIKVYVDQPTGGTRNLIKKIVFGGEEYGSHCRPVEKVKIIAERVATNPGGFGGVGVGFVNPKLTHILKTPKLSRPLGFITKGTPSPKVKKVIAAYLAEAQKPSRSL
jgi:phosphate transport system substrate-binding protein